MKNDGIKSRVKAKGTKGYLIYTMNKEYVFRVYKENRSFTDYDIHHCDLELTINDDDAVFYEFKDGRGTLDHSYEISGENHHTDKDYEIGTMKEQKEFDKKRNE